MWAFLGLKLLPIGSWLKALLTGEIKIPVWILLVPCVMALWFWHDANSAKRDATKWKQHAEQCATARKADAAEWNRQVEEAKAKTAAAEAKGQEAASNAETLHSQLVASRQGLRDYIAAHRVRTAPARPADAPGASSSDAAIVHADAATVPTVEVPTTVLTIADDNYIYAQGCYAFGQELIAKGLAK